MWWGIRLNRFWMFGVIALAGLVGGGYLLLVVGAKSNITTHVLERQQTIARAISGNIITFFEAVGKSTALRAESRSIERRDLTTADDLDAFVEQWRDSGLISGIVLTDSQGVVLFNSNIHGTNDVGTSTADRDYFIWAKNQKKEGGIFFGVPVESKLGASEGQVIVPIASPVFTNSVFSGVVAVAVKFQPLTERNFELFNVSDDTNLYLIDPDGDFLYTRSKSIVPSDEIIETVVANKRGNMTKDGRLLAYSPVPLNSQEWFLIVSSPNKIISNTNLPFYIRQAAVLIFVSLATLTIGVLVSRKNQPR